MLGTLFGATSGVLGSKFDTQNLVDKAADQMNAKSGAEATMAAAMQQNKNIKNSIEASKNKGIIENFNAMKRNADAVSY
jgi:predicted nuclease of restriction endonuclease-like RecB superfamily